ncbi:LysR family transcriptional regulator [Ferrimonas balearica]|uniref:LysR family transcriptional regulator n=1 Tax=Ferrimonas balearica TaxID=44012 RepID=UPI001C993A7B|nr:LysR family transcriptional regulator [Ferrimonas balearica]MBY5991319.1 LysR family transcriptional regulator [Ferrimonas balearica]
MDLLKAMRTYCHVVAHLSFSAAARELGLVTSAVSRQVAELEAHFGCQLLLRTTRAMHLTEEGRYFHREFEQILARVDQLESGASDRQGRIAGHLRITAPQNSAQLGLQKSFSGFLKAQPAVSLSWMMVNRYVNLVEEGVDLAIRVGTLPDSGLVARPFGQLKVMFVASPDYLAQHGTPQHPKELAEHRCLMDSSNRQMGRWRYFEDGEEHQVRVEGPLEVNQGELVAQFAADGLGIAHLPEFMVKTLLDEGQLVPLLTPYSLPSLPISLVYPANRTTSAPLKALLEHLLANRPAALGG